MKNIESALINKGHYVVNQGYPSRKLSIETLAKQSIPESLKQCPKDYKINFVTHSMGGILIRQYLSQNKLHNLNRVVMLGPPNKGSELIDKLGDLPGFHFVGGDAGLQLGTGSIHTPNKIGKAEFDLGIIAGTRSINWILSSLISGDDDGKVSVENTKLKGMNDHIKMPVTHPFMTKNKKVINQVLYFLENGKFDSALI